MNRRLELRRKARRAYESGVREKSKNWGRAVGGYLQRVGVTKPAPWCAAFVYSMALDAGYPAERLPKRRLAGRVAEWKRWAEEHGLLYRPESTTGWSPTPGDLALWINRDGTGHIGIVVAGRFGTTLPGAFLTVEGNTNSRGGRDGDAVLEKVRHLSDLPGVTGWLFIKMGGAPHWGE